MSCKFATVKDMNPVKCVIDNVGRCPFQYWCTTDRCYKCIGDAIKCKHYQEAANSKQLNKK